MKAILNSKQQVIAVVTGDCDDGIQCDSSVQIGMQHKNGNFSPASPATLAEVQQSQSDAIEVACATAIVAGFPSNALGAASTYPSQDIDQRNFQSAVSASIAAPSSWTTSIWCSINGTWSMTQHTSAQVQKVNLDWVAFRIDAQQKCVNLKEQVNAATSVEQVQKIVWV